LSRYSHENTDVAIDAVEIISELTDEDVEAKQGQWDALVDAMVSCVVVTGSYLTQGQLEAGLLDLIIQNFSCLMRTMIPIGTASTKL
jgi:beta-catenin-like protein 1